MTHQNTYYQATYLDKDMIFAVDPIHTTFRGGNNEPLHAWYPYLEGYSPHFVREIIRTYTPNAQTILDPFAGTGTTPLTIMQMGRQGFYCEINPVLRFLIQTKTIVYLTSKEDRSLVIAALQLLLDKLEERLCSCQEDQVLIDTYTHTFGASIFFDNETKSLILRARTLVNQLFNQNILVGNLFCIAVLSSLVSSSNLIRSGDIKYRKSKSDWKKKVPFIVNIKEYLNRIIKDLQEIPVYNSHPYLISANANMIDTNKDIQIDAVITSPPYLNGTNYFRNTKMELWFMRDITTKQDLANLRYQAVVAGINNVTKRKIGLDIAKPIQETVQQLEAATYDQRIPKMVIGYFQDMEYIFTRLRTILTQNAIIAIDIGDSIYAGIHVPTDDLLVQVLELQGYTLVDRVLLRKRTSRNQAQVSQVLLVLKYEGKIE